MSMLHLHVGLPPGRLRRTRALNGKASQRAGLDPKVIHASVSQRDSTMYFAPGPGCPSVIKVAAGIPVPKQDEDRIQSLSASSAYATVLIAAEVLVQTAYRLLGKPGRPLSLLNPSDHCRYLTWINEYCQTHYLHFYHKDRQPRSESGAPQQEQDGEGESQHKSSRPQQGQSEEKSSAQQQRRHLTWPSMAGQKRSLKTEDSSDDEEEKRPKKINQQSEKTPRYACPFYKHNPERFVEERSCRGPGWPTVQRVKEHVLRKHKAPDYQCFRCLKEFEDNQLLMQHFRAEETCEVRQSPSASSQLDGNKMMLLKQRSKTTATEDQKWYSMYRIIFPDEASLPEPYYKPETRDAAFPEFPSRAVALEMFKENLHGVLTKRNLDAKSSDWGLQDPEMMGFMISGAIAAFDDTFAAICGQRTSPCLDDELPFVGGRVLEEKAARKCEVPPVADFDATYRSSSRAEEIIEPTPNEVSNPALQLDLGPTLSTAGPQETGLYSSQQQQTLQAYQFPSAPHPECFSSSSLTLVGTPQLEDLTGISGGIPNPDLFNQYAVENRIRTDTLPYADAQGFESAQKGYSYDQSDLVATEDDIGGVFPHHYQYHHLYELDISGI